MGLRLPRFVIAKSLASGGTGFYFTIPTYFRKQGCNIPNYPLGSDYRVACGDDGRGGRAAALNARFDEWKQSRQGIPIETAFRRWDCRLVVSHLQEFEGVSGESLGAFAERTTNERCCLCATSSRRRVIASVIDPFGLSLLSARQTLRQDYSRQEGRAPAAGREGDKAVQQGLARRVSSESREFNKDVVTHGQVCR